MSLALPLVGSLRFGSGHDGHLAISDGRHVSAAGFGSPEEFVRDALVRMLTEDSHHEAAVLGGMQGDVAPLSGADLAGVRQLVREARGRRSA